jgi:hypothetical protein
MLRKMLLVVVMATGLFIFASGTASAWDIIADKSGHGTVTLRSWTIRYNQVAFVASHAGTQVDVSLVVNCRNGDHYDNTWNDGGRTFRFILHGLGNSGRCNHTFRVAAHDSFPEISLVVSAQG